MNLPQTNSIESAEERLKSPKAISALPSERELHYHVNVVDQNHKYVHETSIEDGKVEPLIAA